MRRSSLSRTQMILLGWLAASLGTTMVLAQPQANACTLNCPVDAPCIMGSADFGHSNLIGLENSLNGMHCDCPSGWTGIFCNKRYEACSDSHDCYHGGECVDGLFDNFGNPQHFCDCSKAQENGLAYVGKYCETPFESSCSATDPDLFCVNGGDCNPNYSNDGIPCMCPDGWEGFHCEFKTGQVPDCDLNCQNDGVCVVGIKSPSEADLMRRIWTEAEISDHMRCLCPSGVGGPLCEATSQLCGDPNFPDADYCYNGGECVTTTTTRGGVTTVDYRCDCTSASDDFGNRFAGAFCTARATVRCSETDPNLFCTNGGSCAENGCNCPPGFEGHKCEFDVRDFQPPIEDPQPNIEACGSLYCLNGGTCVTEGTAPICDCSTAYNFATGKAYAGDACQFESTTMCSTSSTSLADLAFCVHDGACKPDGSCDCPQGWTGDHCEVHTKDQATSQDPSCGNDNVCYNGGKCVETTVIDDETGITSQVYNCDCSQAFDKNHLYAGESCEFKSTVLCTEPEFLDGVDSLFGSLFCTNGGTCGKNGGANVFTGCDCPDGFTGFSCEYLDLEEDPNQDDLDAADAQANTTPCGDLTCKNGGTCITTSVTMPDGTSQQEAYCDCSTTATNSEVFAGLECENRATAFCTAPPSLDLSEAIFCVQGGRCKENVYEGCDCPTGWSGFSCEYPINLEDLLDNGSNNNNNKPQDVLEGATACGDKLCYNGGTCQVFQEVDNRGELQDIYACDCTTTATATEIYGGETCSYKSTSVCQQAAFTETLAGALVCLNHGVCKENPLDGCDCPSGFTGAICEFPIEDDEHAAQGEACGDGYCYNGGTCVTTKIIDELGGEIEEVRCDCSSAFGDADLYAGESCEYKSTTFCTEAAEGNNLLGVLFCVNGGQCKENPYEGCDCPSGWSGYFCEYEADPMDVINDANDYQVDDCGEFLCLNGGTCSSTSITQTDGTRTSVDRCDCSNAYNEDDIFAGPNCEYKATTFCSAPSINEDLGDVLFCVNGGRCNPDNVLAGCECPPHWTGLNCEIPEDDLAFDTGDDAFDPTCHLTCANGGQCAKGAKDNGFLQDTIQDVGHLNQTYHPSLFEHCVCPEGFVGLTCEHKVEVCGANEHFCLHGSTCVQENDGRHSCDCSEADAVIGHGDQSFAFAGDSCQHPASDICIQGDDLPARPLFFCVNQGSCNAYVGENDFDPGCSCTKDWTGPHCEIRIQASSTSPLREAWDTLLLILPTLLVLVGFLAVVTYCIRSQRKSDLDGSLSCMRLRRRRRYGRSEDSKNMNLASSSDPIVTTGIRLTPDDEPGGFTARLTDDGDDEPYHDEPDSIYRDDPDVNQLDNVDII